jgi:hypothetical protein
LKTLFLFWILFEYQSTRQERNAIITNWVNRKYTFNLIVRLDTSLFIKKMDEKNNVNCANDISKQDFIKNSQKLMEICHSSFEISLEI